MKRTSFQQAECPVARALDGIGDWWSLLIVRDAFDGMRRFGQFQKSLGISKGILTTRLKHLVAIGILEPVPIAGDGGYQEYVLSDKGRDLFLVTASLRQWGEDHCFAKGERHSVLVENRSGRRVERLELLSSDGTMMDASTTSVRKISEQPRGSIVRKKRVNKK